jgi:hypothetical protein
MNVLLNIAAEAVAALDSMCTGMPCAQILMTFPLPSTALHDRAFSAAAAAAAARLAYSRWLTEWVQRLDPKASDELLILARGK